LSYRFFPARGVDRYLRPARVNGGWLHTDRADSDWLNSGRDHHWIAGDVEFAPSGGADGLKKNRGFFFTFHPTREGR